MKRYNPITRPFLFHISLENCDGKTFNPRIPTDAYNNDEDTKHKRICVSTSLIGCILAIDPCLWCPAVKWFVHVPEDLDELYESGSVLVPNEKEVPDVKTTREKWITKKTRMKCIGIIANCSHIYGKRRFRWVKKF